MDAIIKKALEVPYEYWERGMEIVPSDPDGEAMRQIIAVCNVSFVKAALGALYDDFAVGRALNDAPYLQATLGPILGGMTIVLSRAMDNTVTAAGDEYAIGTFLMGSLADVDDDSPARDAVGYTADGRPTMERIAGFFRDIGIKHLDPMESYAIKMTVT